MASDNPFAELQRLLDAPYARERAAEQDMRDAAAWRARIERLLTAPPPPPPPPPPDLSPPPEPPERVPATPFEAAERFAGMLMPHVIKVSTLHDDARGFAEDSVRHVDHPGSAEETASWRKGWGATFYRLHLETDEVVKAHREHAARYRAWSPVPGFGSKAKMLGDALNEMAKWIDAARGSLALAGCAGGIKDDAA